MVKLTIVIEADIEENARTIGDAKKIVSDYMRTMIWPFPTKPPVVTAQTAYDEETSA